MAVASVGARGVTARNGGAMRVSAHEHLGALFATLFRS
jgi:hypothetical protein